MITASDVKNYLRIDYTDDDALIESAITAGYDYLADAIDNYEQLYAGNELFARKADSWVLTHWMPPMYDQREGMLTDRSSNLNYAARAMLTQLQMYKYEPEEEEDADE